MRSSVLRVAFALAGLGLAACSPAAEKAEPAGADVPTPRNPFFGTWEITHARIAPWWKGPGDDPVADPAFARLTLQADKTTGPPLLTCDTPNFATNIVSPDGLFHGNLPSPAADAAALGFTSTEITTMSYSCASGAADISLDFPMLDEDQIMLGLDNVIYTFERTGR